MIDVPVLVKDALRDGRMQKNYRFLVLNDDGTTDFTIDNDNLVSESVSIDERMCSGDTIKFGLCEGSSLEFQYFEKPNITGRRIQAFVDVEYMDKSVTTNSSDFSVTVQKDATVTFTLVNGGWASFVIRRGSGTEVVALVANQPTKTVQFYRGDVITASTVSTDYPVSISATDYIFPLWHSIPMGFFDVAKCSRQASTGIIKVTAYNKLQSDYLDQKANDSETIEYYWGSYDKEVSLFELLNALLKGYAVEPDYQEITGEAPTDGYIQQTLELYNPTAITFNMTSRYGVDTPLSYYEWKKRYSSAISPPSNVHPVVAVRLTEFNTDKDYRLFRSLMGKIEEFERAVYNRLVAEYDRGDFSATGESIVGRMAGNFQSVIGAYSRVQVSAPGVIAFRYNYYSTIRYEYEEANGIPHTRPVSGVSGQYDHTYKLSELFVDLVPDDITFRMPVAFGISNSDATIYYAIDGMAKGILVPNTYGYYTDSSLTTYEEGTTEGMLTPIDSTYNSYSKYVQAFEVDEDELAAADRISVTPSALPDFTLRELQSATFETLCQFGQLSRITDLFSGVELNHSRLYPAEDLYPATDLYPDGAAASANKSMYSKLWADEGNIHKWRYLIITYKGLNGDNQEEDFTLQRTVNADGTDDYNMSDNWLFRNLVWTAADVGDYADAMVAKMQNLTWFPFEMWCAGLPYLETGDEIEIPLGENSYTSYILQRQLKGIQNLQDTYINGTLDIF